MTTQDQINIMTAYVNGEPIERRHKDNDVWTLIPNDEEFLWCFRHYEYRIRSVELVPGRKYESTVWMCPGVFVCIHDGRYVFMSQNPSGLIYYWYTEILPSHIRLVE